MHRKPETSFYHNLFSYLLNSVEIVVLKSKVPCHIERLTLTTQEVSFVRVKVRSVGRLMILIRRLFNIYNKRLRELSTSVGCSVPQRLAFNEKQTVSHERWLQSCLPIVNPSIKVSKILMQRRNNYWIIIFNSITRKMILRILKYR